MISKFIIALIATVGVVDSLRIGPLKGSCLVIQNKGGGHGTIGYQVCKTLKSEHPDLKLSILQGLKSFNWSLKF